MTEIIKNSDYKSFIADIKSRIKNSQIKAAVQVNLELLRLYWHIGSKISEKQQSASWGKGIVVEISKDLKSEFPNIKGFSTTNLHYMRKWYFFYEETNLPQVVGENDTLSNLPQVVGDLKSNQLSENIFLIPWGHNREIITKCSNIDEALFYVEKTIENSWSRSVLTHQIESNLFDRAGKAITNFNTKLPLAQSDLANQILKDPYSFDFLTIREKYAIGILICKSKKRRVVEYALKNLNQPIGVSEYELTEILPDELKSSLPTIEEIEAELENREEQ